MDNLIWRWRRLLVWLRIRKEPVPAPIDWSKVPAALYQADFRRGVDRDYPEPWK